MAGSSTGPNAARGDRAAYMLLVLATLAFGGTWVAGKLAVASIPPMTIAAGRFMIASVLLWMWMKSKRLPARPLTAADLPTILAMGLTAVAGYNVLFLNGLRLAPASDGAIIVPAFAPIMTAALAWLWQGERVRAAGLMGFLAATVGLALVIRPGEGGQAPARLLGDVLFLVGAGCWAIYTLVGKTATARYTAVKATLYATVCGCLVLVPFAAAERGWPALRDAPASAWIGLLYLAVFGTVVSFVMLYEGISRLGAIRASAFAYLVPIFGVASSAALLGEQITTATVAGGVLVMLGLWLVQRGSSRTADH